MLQILQAGGPVLYIIVFCSVIAMAVAVERFYCFRQAKCDLNTFLPPLENAIKLGKFSQAIQYCEQSKGLIPGVVLTGLHHKDESIEDIRKILIDSIQISVLPILNRRLTMLATIAKGAPMLGLLGTVLGMIDMFEVIGKAGLGDPQKLADGIRLALFTTAGGLMVAIPVVFVHAYFKSQIRNFELDFYSCLTKFLRLMRKHKEARQA